MCDVIVHVAEHVILISGVNIFIVYFSREITVMLYAKKLVVPIFFFIYIFLD